MKLITAQGLTEASPLSAVASVDFNAIAQQLNLGRTAKQCRDRWKNYLRGGIKKGGWSKDEEELIKVKAGDIILRSCRPRGPRGCCNVFCILLVDPLTHAMKLRLPSAIRLKDMYSTFGPK